MNRGEWVIWIMSDWSFLVLCCCLLFVLGEHAKNFKQRHWILVVSSPFPRENLKHFEERTFWPTVIFRRNTGRFADNLFTSQFCGEYLTVWLGDLQIES